MSGVIAFTVAGPLGALLVCHGFAHSAEASRTIPFIVELPERARLHWRPSATSAEVGASRDCVGLLTPALLLRHVRRHQVEASREFRSGRETQLPPVDVERLLRARAGAVAGARRPAALWLRDLCASYAGARAQGLIWGASPPTSGPVTSCSRRPACAQARAGASTATTLVGRAAGLPLSGLASSAAGRVIP
jgi:hypothetical protein